MNYKDFKNKYLGTFYTEKWMKDAECVALAKLASREIHGITLWSFWWSAKSGWENKSNTFSSDKWVKIPNTPTWVPQEWDLVFWSFGKYGHVAVFDSWNVNSMITLSQNSTGKLWNVKWDEIIAKSYSYKDCLWWYRPIKNIPAVAVAINGALDEPLAVKLEARIPKKIPKIKQNTNKKIKPYDQAKNPYCTAYSSAWAWSYNHWKTFTNKEIFDWCDPILKWKGAIATRIADKFAKWQGGKCLILTIFSTTAEKLLNSWYALVISTICPPEFWTDWINDWVVDWKDYTKKTGSGHAIMLIKENGKYKLVNSWGNYELKGKFNSYEIDAKTLFESSMIRSECSFIY